MTSKSPAKKAASRRRRDYGSGGLVDLRNGRWKLTVAFVAPDGKRRHRTQRFNGSRTEATAALAAFVADNNRGKNVYDGGLTYAQLVEKFLTAKALAQEPTTVALYRRTLGTHAIPIIGKVRLQDLTAAHITSVLSNARNASQTKQRGQRLGSTSKRNLRVYIGASLQFAFEQDYVLKNVCAQVDVPRSEHVERVEVTIKIASAVMTAFHDTPLEPLTVFALFTGARRGEMCAIRWSDIDLDSGKFAIRRAAKNVDRRVVIGKVKTRRSERSNTLPEFALDALRAHRIRQREQDLALGIRRDDGYVFRPGPGDEPWDPNEVSRSFGRIVRRAKLPKGLRLHDLRHGWATFSFATGTPLKVVSEALGHSSVAITSAIYVHVLDEAQTENSRRLDVYLGNALRDSARLNGSR